MKFKLFPVHTIDEQGRCSCGGKPGCSPGKHPATKNGFKDAKLMPFDDPSLVGRNVGLVCGDGLVVIDVDPRNGGNETLAKLIEEHGELPITVTVETGGGGYHYYYFDKTRRLKKSSLGPGVDFQAAGSYVIAPPSKHASGQNYRWEEGADPWSCPIENLPDWVAKLVEKAGPTKETMTSPQIANTLDYQRALEVLKHIPSNDYHVWIKVGMALKDTGAHDAFLHWENWSRSSQKFKEGECLRVWNSLRGSGITVASIFALAKESQQQKTKKVFYPTIPPEPIGMLKTLADAIEEAALVPYRTSAIASAISAIGAIAQGKFNIPKRGKTNLYTVIVAKPASGKNDYLDIVEHICSSVHPRLCCEDFGSDRGISRVLSEFRVRILIQDEILEPWQNQYASANGPNIGVRRSLLLLWSMAQSFKGHAIKKVEESTPTIKHPRLSIFGAGTREGLRKLLRYDAFIGNGLLSRLDLIFEDEFKDIDPKRAQREVSDELIDMICHNLGIKSSDDLDPPEKDKVSIDENLLVEWGDWWNDCRKKIHNSDDHVAASIYGRIAEKALRIAAIHCIADGRRRIELDDLAFGKHWMEFLAFRLQYELENYGGNNHRAELCRQISCYIKQSKKGVTSRDLSRKFRVLKRFEKKDIMDDLLEGGDIRMIKQRLEGSKKTTTLYVGG